MRSAREVAYSVGLAAIVLLPQFYQATNSMTWGFPTVVSGDEPHYLVLLNSFIMDGDFDLRNNYLSVHEGSNQAGVRFAGSAVDHHSSYWIGGQRWVWRDLFNQNVWMWPRDSRGHLIPQVRRGVDPALAQKPEAPAHPVGIAILLAPIVFPFRGTQWVEHIAIFCSALATLLAAFFYRRILMHFSKSERAVWVTIAAVFLASPLLFYSRSFFNEPFITLFITAAFALVLTPAHPFWAGACLGLATLMKPQDVILAIPLSLLFLQKRDFKSVLFLALAPAVAILMTLWWNDKLYGSPWLGPYPFYRGDLWTGTWGLSASSDRGLVWFAPALAFSAFGWPGLLQRFRLEALIFLLGFVLLFGIAAWSAYWDGGSGYGPRLITSAFPLLGIGLVHAFERRPFAWAVPRWALYVVILAGALANFFAVMHYATSWGTKPVANLQRYLHI